MAQKIDLTQFKAAGVYTIEFDESTSPIITNEIITLVVGSSKKGIFNRPVLIQDKKQFLSIFGNIDRGLERQGSYFHRTALKQLEAGAILAMALIPYNSDESSYIPPTPVDGNPYFDYGVVNSLPSNGYPADKTDYISYSLATREANGEVTEKLTSSYYNTDKFWIPSTEKLLSTRSSGDASKILNLTNLSTEVLTIITRKAKVPQFEISCKEWFGSDIPEYVRENDLVSDYFIEVIVVGGDYSPSKYAELSYTYPFYQYFDGNGLKVDKLEDFLTNSQVDFRARYVGSIIPDLVDGNGTNHSLETIINQTTTQTGLLCAVNKDALDNIVYNESKIDLVGHGLINALQDSSFDEVNMLSYKFPIANNYLVYKNTVDGNFTTTKPFVTNTVTVDDSDVSASNITTPSGWSYASAVRLTISRTTNNYDSLIESLSTDSLLICGYGNSGAQNIPVNIWRYSFDSSNLIIDLKVDYLAAYPVSPNPSSDLNLMPTGSYKFATALAEQYEDYSNDVIKFHKNSTIYKLWESGYVTNGDNVILSGVTPSKTYAKFVKSTEIIGLADVDILTMTIYSDTNFTIQQPLLFSTNTQDREGNLETSGSAFWLISQKDALSQRIACNYIGGNSFNISGTDTRIKLGTYIVTSDGNSLTRILSIAANYDGTKTVTCVDNVKNYTGNYVESVYGLDSVVTSYNTLKLGGFVLGEQHLPNKTLARRDKIVNVMFDTNIAKTLADVNTTTWRYLVDSFDGFVEVEVGSWIGKLCKMRGKALGIINAPSIATLSKSNDPLFTDVPTNAIPNPSISPKWIGKGGNTDTNPSFLMKLPTEENGAKFVGVYTPNLKVRDLGRTITVPPAMYVGKKFRNKHRAGKPFVIVAGKENGLIEDTEVVGLEYEYSIDDRSYLEPVGFNPIINVNLGGIQIFGNSTSFQRLTSKLNNIHVRDTLVTIETKIEQVLNNYLWLENVPSIRLEIEQQIRTYLSSVKRDGAIYGFSVIINNTNNTPEIIDQNFGILDVIVEPANGFQKFVNRITIQKTGGIVASGFTLQ